MCKFFKINIQKDFEKFVNFSKTSKYFVKERDLLRETRINSIWVHFRKQEFRAFLLLSYN